VNKQLGSLILATALCVFSIVVGFFGFMILEGYNAIDAFYMTIITVGTVGYTEVQVLSDKGKLFTSFYILMNLGIFAYVVSVITSFLFEGKLKSILSNYMSDKELSKLKDHVVVCGYGRNGSKACEELNLSGRDFVVIEKNPETRQSVPLDKNFKMMVADATKDDVLKLAGIDRASVVIITTPSDAANVFITLTARALNPKVKIIVRASERETEEKLYRAGADKVIMPDILGGMFMAQLVTKPVVIEFLDLLSGVSGLDYRLEEVHYDKIKDQYRDQSLKDLKVRETTGATVIGIKDNINGLIPSPSRDTIFGKDDTLIVLGHESNLTQFFKVFTKQSYHEFTKK
jgi:voltage-gated potassium channel